MLNDLDQDQDLHSVNPDLDRNCLDNKSMKNYPACKKLLVALVTRKL